MGDCWGFCDRTGETSPVKGRPSNRLMRDFRTLNRTFWGRPLWARGYFVATSGRQVTDEVIAPYFATLFGQVVHEPKSALHDLLCGWLLAFGCSQRCGCRLRRRRFFDGSSPDGEHTQAAATSANSGIGPWAPDGGSSGGTDAAFSADCPASGTPVAATASSDGRPMHSARRTGAYLHRTCRPMICPAAPTPTASLFTPG